MRRTGFFSFLLFSLLITATMILSGCASYLFFPSRYLHDDPAKRGLEFEEVRIPSYDGTSLYGWYFHHAAHRKNPMSKPKGVIFFAHGNGGNVSSQYQALMWVLDHGYDYYVFDYRGYGSSDGERPSPPEAVGDTIAALRWIDARAKKERIPLVAYGQSLGSALLVSAIAEERLRKSDAPEKPDISFIALDSTFLSFGWAAASVLSQSWITTPFQPLAFLLVIDEGAPRERIRELSPTPTLFFHGDEDHLIDFRLGREAYETALEPKEFVRIPGGGHISAFWGKEKEKYRTIFLERLAKVLNKRP